MEVFFKIKTFSRKKMSFVTSHRKQTKQTFNF